MDGALRITPTDAMGVVGGHNMEYWYIVVYIVWATQGVEMTTYGPYKTPVACERGRGYVELPTRTDLITISPCFKRYAREKS